MVICFFKQKTAYEMRISDWSSDVCSSDLIEQYFVAEFIVRVRRALRFDDAMRLRRQPPGLPRQAADIVMVKLIAAFEERKSVVSGKSVSVRVDLGGCRTIQKKTTRHLLFPILTT